MIGYYKMSIIGTAHQAKKDGVCQDASDVVVLNNGWVVAAIADGLGSAKKSEIGSTTAVKTILSFVSENYPDKWHEESLMSLLRTAYHKALKTIRTLAEENQDSINDYDTTLTTVIYNGTNTVYGHVGDGGIIALSSYGDYTILTEKQKGEYFNETYTLRDGPDIWSFGFSKEDVCSLIIMTDGIFDIACPWILAKKDQPIYLNYVRPFMDNNILKVSTPADFDNAQAEIIDFFKSPYSKQITDDKTIVGIINTNVLPEIKPDEFYAEPDWENLMKEHHDKLYEHKPSLEDDDSLKQVKIEKPNKNQTEDCKENIAKPNSSEEKVGDVFTDKNNSLTVEDVDGMKQEKKDPPDKENTEDNKKNTSSFIFSDREAGGRTSGKFKSSTVPSNNKNADNDKETHDKKGFWKKLFGKP